MRMEFRVLLHGGDTPLGVSAWIAESIAQVQFGFAGTFAGSGSECAFPPLGEYVECDWPRAVVPIDWIRALALSAEGPFALVLGSRATPQRMTDNREV